MESVAKSNLQNLIPEAKFSFSKPGFLTYKLTSAQPEEDLQKLERAVGVRGWGWSLQGMHKAEPNWQDLAAKFSLDLTPSDSGRPTKKNKKPENFLATFQLLLFLQQDSFFQELETTEELTEQWILELKSLGRENPFDRLHIWFRDGLVPAGHFRTDKKETPAITGFDNLCQQLASKLKEANLLKEDAQANQIAKKDEGVLDLCLISPTHWWSGYHNVRSKPQRWPGGALPISQKQDEPVSRAYYKVREAFAWAGLPAQKGDRCAEIGSSPGGSCQWLLQQGLKVIGIDPADMAPEVQNHSNFRHIRRRGSEVKRNDLAGIRWLLSDANVHPDIVLETVRSLLQHPSIDPEGVVLTIKPPKQSLLQTPEIFEQKVKDLGFPNTMIRQLVFNKQEFCIVGKK